MEMKILSEKEKEMLNEKYLGKTIEIINMSGETHYAGKTGVVKFIDDIGQLHGTWGGCGIIPDIDSFKVVG